MSAYPSSKTRALVFSAYYTHLLKSFDLQNARSQEYENTLHQQDTKDSITSSTSAMRAHANQLVAAIKGGVGVPMEELMETSIESLELLFVILYACEVIYCVIMYTLKTSILVSYNRVFGVAGWVSWVIKGMFGLCTVWSFTALFMFCFQCRPIEAA
jgi:hypothetical protein